MILKLGAVGKGSENAVFYKALAGKAVDRSKNCIVLHIRDQHVIPLPQSALDHRVQGLRGVQGKDRVLGRAETEKPGQSGAAFVYFIGGSER